MRLLCVQAQRNTTHTIQAEVSTSLWNDSYSFIYRQACLDVWALAGFNECLPTNGYGQAFVLREPQHSTQLTLIFKVITSPKWQRTREDKNIHGAVFPDYSTCEKEKKKVWPGRLFPVLFIKQERGRRWPARPLPTTEHSRESDSVAATAEDVTTDRQAAKPARVRPTRRKRSKLILVRRKLS